MGRIQILSALLYLGLCSGASCMYSFHPDFVTAQGIRVYLDGVHITKAQMDAAEEILLSNIIHEGAVRGAIKDGALAIKFTNEPGVCGNEKAYGCYWYGAITIYVWECAFEGSLSHEFVHFALDVIQADPDQNHESELFCGYPDSCYEEDTQKMLKEELCP